MVRSSQIGQCTRLSGCWVIWFCSLTIKSGLEGIRWRRLELTVVGDSGVCGGLALALVHREHFGVCLTYLLAKTDAFCERFDALSLFRKGRGLD
jgi:hypothetical protein